VRACDGGLPGLRRVGRAQASAEAPGHDRFATIEERSRQRAAVAGDEGARPLFGLSRDEPRVARRMVRWTGGRAGRDARSTNPRFRIRTSRRGGYSIVLAAFLRLRLRASACFARAFSPGFR
jgi:hypothetical protein